MNRVFLLVVEKLDPAFRSLLAMKPVHAGELPREAPKAGIYLFSEGRAHLYIGRTNCLRRRISEHGRPSSSHYSAPFAFKLAREATGQLRATYRAAGSRNELVRDPSFRSEFARQKERVRAMDVRYVEEADPLCQALLEVYASIALRTRYNDFDNH